MSLGYDRLLLLHYNHYELPYNYGIQNVQKNSKFVLWIRWDGFFFFLEDQKKVSRLKRCPDFRGEIIHMYVGVLIIQCVHVLILISIEVSGNTIQGLRHWKKFGGRGRGGLSVHDYVRTCS